MGRCSGRTLSPRSGKLLFWIDENVNLPRSQNWAQRWTCCPNQIEPIIGSDGHDDVPSFDDQAISFGFSSDKISSFRASESDAVEFEEIGLEFSEENDEDETRGINDCIYVNRNVEVSVRSISALTSGEERLFSEMRCGSCWEIIHIDAITRGKNPSRAAVGAELGDDILRAIAWQESRWQQFDPSGRPLVNRNGNGTADWGIMQINQASNYLHWDWKANVARGRQILAEKRRHALAYLGRHGSYNDEMLENEMLQRYNGGRYHQWDAEQGKWVVSPPTGNHYVAGIRKILAAKPW